MIRSVFALDIALVSGWAFARPDYDPVPSPLERANGKRTKQPLAGAMDFRFMRRGDELGPMYAYFRDWLLDQFAVLKPGIFVFEAPLPVHSGSSAARILLGMAAIAEEVGTKAGEFSGMLTREASVQWIKQHATGKGNSSKDDMLAAARAAGWTISENNAVDAAWLADYYIARQRQDEKRRAG